MATDPSTTFAEALKRFRTAAGLTQEALAERAGLSARGISDLERGRRTNPYFGTVHLLADALALNAEDRAILIASARSQTPPQAPDAPADAPAHLPVPLTALIGREENCRAVCGLLGQSDVRLVTLTGPGGVGKTRLALQVATDLRAAYPGGVCFVPLAALRDPHLVLTTIAHVLDLRNTGADAAFAHLVAHLRGKRLLLVLDNCEHLLAAASDIGNLLAACPGITMLATSRAALHISGEHEYSVPPLTLPDLQQPLDLDGLARVPAVALFLERLSAFDPRFALTAIDAPAIAEICRRVDGLPLAIELAVARGRHLTWQELAARLHRRLSVLTHGPRDLPLRQQTLRDTIAWSYDLLAPQEQRLLRWLAVFSGGWTLEHAEALYREGAGVEESGPRSDVMDGLAALVDSSLVRVERGADGRTRYGMLETIREFAEEQLFASGAEEAVRLRHAQVMLGFTDRAERGLQSGKRTEWSRASVAEVDNVRAALQWALDHQQTELALRISGNLDWFWDAVGRDPEGWAWSQAALVQENVNRDGVGYARALYTAGVIAWNMGEFARSFEMLSESVTRLRALEDRRGQGQALCALALTSLYQGNPDAARTYAYDAVTMFESVDDPWNLGLALFCVGEVMLLFDTDTARQAYERSLAVFRDIGDPWGIAHAITGLGGLAMRQRDYTTARALLEEGLALRRSINNLGAIATSLTSLGELARHAGEYTRAAAYLEEGLARFRELGDAEQVAWGLYNLGMLAVRQQDADRAMEAFQECLALRAKQGNAAQIARAIAGVARAALMRGAARSAAHLWGAVEGIRARCQVAAPEDEDGDEEQRTVALLHLALDGATVSNELARGRLLTLDDAVRLTSDLATASSKPR